MPWNNVHMLRPPLSDAIGAHQYNLLQHSLSNYAITPLPPALDFEHRYLDNALAAWNAQDSMTYACTGVIARVPEDPEH